MSGKVCAQCGTPSLRFVEEQGVRVESCVTCEGLWLEVGQILELILAHDPLANLHFMEFAEEKKLRGLSERKCPDCSVELEQVELSEKNSMLIESCVHCSGTWIDRARLARVQAGHQLTDACDVLEAERSRADWLFQFLLRLPVEFNVEPAKTAKVTSGLIFLNCLAYMLSNYVGHEGVVAALGTTPNQIGQASWFVSLIGAQFIHLNFFHLLGNMYFLWILGDNVEDVLGHGRFLLFYLTAGVAGGLMYTLYDPISAIPAVGASGAISGVIAAYAVLFRRSRLTAMFVLYQFKVAAPIYVSVWALFNLVALLLHWPGVAWEAHLGGLAIGFLFVTANYKELLRERPLLRLLNDCHFL